MNIQKQLMPATHYNERVDKKTGKPIKVDMLVLHCSAYDKDKLIKVFMDLGVSAHYIVDQDGSVTQLVDEKYRAWHAGLGSWNGVDNINGHSIGIEIINPTLGHIKPYTKEQIESVKWLAHHIIKKYHIKPYNVFAHSDMAPTRKYDPGRLFPWQELAKNGIGLWPLTDSYKVCTKHTSSLLKEIGYPIEDPKAALYAFQRHYAPECVADVEDKSKDQMNFLIDYDKNLPTILPSVHSTPILRKRLITVARLFNKYRKLR